MRLALKGNKLFLKQMLYYTFFSPSGAAINNGSAESYNSRGHYVLEPFAPRLYCISFNPIAQFQIRLLRQRREREHLRCRQ